MKPYRSMLFVPGHKGSWADKGVASGADALILDLEDSVPAAGKEQARVTVAETIDRLHGARPDLWVRANPEVSGLLGADLEAVVRPGLTGLFLAKVFDAQEIVRLDAVLTHIEQRDGLEPGAVRLIVSYETASSMAHCEEIAGASPRVASLLGATGPNADVGRELGFEFTPAGLETLYLRSRLVLAARANGLHHPVTGVWQDIKDLDGCRRFCLDNRALGYRGLVAIHPSHVAVANEVFSPTPEQVDHARRMIAAFRAAEAAGSAAVDFEGQHIDIAHVKTAEGVIALADAMAVHA
ncbi:HpcH/HpaI aldolase/citrate lyase family protein [Amycolatopsis australiensis]|uniref:Citrate lyase subunit beta / citryl-CoA lyase n=1 Tax=Amycolatopsis australiensis TaxID=546364 RepID=A0A1K1S749_9PSEU|nr:CoA ester lyase [Amycolatopsis australiensis]SFW79900.1 citrate lyase subunit beta / citryl-CoA lyase [Amycolatopsis australiensis]